MKKNIVLLFAVFSLIKVNAQNAENYLSFDAGAGIHQLKYTLLGKEFFSAEPGFNFNAGYSHFFNKSIGFNTGIGIHTFSSGTLLNFQETSEAVDSDGDNYQHKTDFTNVSERQKMIFAEIPLYMQFRQPVASKISLFMNAGLKISVPVVSEFSTTGGEIRTTGYYPQWNVTLYDMPNHGFFTDSTFHSGNNLLKIAFSGVAQIGGSYRISETSSLYAGFYYHHGFNILNKNNFELLYDAGKFNGVLNTSYASNLKTLSFGFKIGMHFLVGKR